MEAGTRASKLHESFDRFATAVSARAGNPAAFAIAVGVLVVWVLDRAPARLLEHLAADHQHRNDDRHVPDGVPDPALREQESLCRAGVGTEPIAATETASNRLIDIEDLSDDELERLHGRFAELAARSEVGPARSE